MSAIRNEYADTLEILKSARFAQRKRALITLKAAFDTEIRGRFEYFKLSKKNKQEADEYQEQHYKLIYRLLIDEIERSVKNEDMQGFIKYLIDSDMAENRFEYWKTDHIRFELLTAEYLVSKYPDRRYDGIKEILTTKGYKRSGSEYLISVLAAMAFILVSVNDIFALKSMQFPFLPYESEIVRLGFLVVVPSVILIPFVLRRYKKLAIYKFQMTVLEMCCQVQKQEESAD